MTPDRKVRATDLLLSLLAILITMAELAYSRQGTLRAPTTTQLVLMVTGAAEVCYGLYLAVRGPAAARTE